MRIHRPLALAALSSALWLSLSALAPARAVAEQAPRVDLYTMGQGEVIFERYGHAALCVMDAGLQSTCYNYGTTDFAAPIAQIGWSFLRGTARFWVSRTTLTRMLRAYQASDRSIYRQTLPLSDQQARELADRLAFDAREENKYYVYHHFDDNCTTRVRDHIDAVTQGALSREGDAPDSRDYWELGRQGIADLTPLVVAAHFAFGRGVQDHPTRYELMFLPQFLREDVAQLGAPAVLVYERVRPPLPRDGSRGTAWIVLMAIVIAVPAWLSWAFARGDRLGAGLSGVLLGLVGLVIWAVVLSTAVPELRWNENVLVFWPTDLLLGALGPRRRRSYARLRLTVLLVVSIGLALGAFVQPLAAVLLIPIATLATAVVPARRGRRVIFAPRGERDGAATESLRA